MAGLALLVLAVVAAMVVGTRNTKYVTGEPGVAPIADPPAVGDCLTGAMAQGAFPAIAPTGPCHGIRFGEVVAVFPHSLARLGQDNSESQDLTTTPEGDCATKGMQFIGLSFPVIQGSATDPPTWFPSTSLGPGMLEPDPLAQQFGADWTACVVSVYVNDNGSTGYTGTLALVHVTRDYPSNAAICWSDPQLDQTAPVPCRLPHAVEEFGRMWDMESSTKPAALHHSCLRLVKEMTGMADPTAAGALQIRVVRGADYQAATNQDTTLAGFNCIVQADQGKQLTGPLLGLGDGPLPLH